MSEEFMEMLAQLPDNDIYYFLTTITNMALNRKEQDALFIQSVTLQLFKVSVVDYIFVIIIYSYFWLQLHWSCIVLQIGFVNGAVRDKCMKPARILISSLTNKYPHLISDLMLALKKDFILVGKVITILLKMCLYYGYHFCQISLYKLVYFRIREKLTDLDKLVLA